MKVSGARAEKGGLARECGERRPEAARIVVEKGWREPVRRNGAAIEIGSRNSVGKGRKKDGHCYYRPTGDKPGTNGLPERSVAKVVAGGT
jgi:hypothetical protein